jgi:signal peptidase I
MIDDPHVIEEEERKSRLKGAVAAVGWFSLTVTQWTSMGLAAFAVIPLILSLFLGFTFTTILSGSMDPLMKVGDVLVTRTATGAELKKGAIVGVDYEGTRYIHRVIDVAADGTATTKGDASSEADLFKPQEKDLWGVSFHVIKQPLAAAVRLFIIDVGWFGEAKTIVGAGTWGALPDLRAGAPVGPLALIVAVLLTWWLIPDFIAFVQNRAERRKSPEFQNDESEPKADIPSVNARASEND